MYKKHCLHILFVFLLYITGGQAFAQAKPDADTLIAKAGIAVYNNPKSAVALGLQAYDAAGSDSKKQISSLTVVSNAYFALKDGKNAKKYAFKALSLAQSTGDYVNQVKLYGLLGNHYQVLKLNAKARFYLDKAEAIMQQHVLPEDMRYLKGNIFAVKGNSYKNDLDCDFAITYFDKAIYEFKHTTRKSAATNLKLVMVQKGYCLLDKQMPNEAAAIFSQAIQNTSATQLFDTWVYAKIGLSRSHQQKKEYTEAVTLLAQALDSFPQGGQTDTKSELYRNLSENYSKLNNLPKYRFYNSLYHQTLNTVTTSKETSFNWLANELSADAEEKLQDTQKIYNLYLIAVSALGITLLFILAIAIRKKQKKVNTLKKILFRKTLNS